MKRVSHHECVLAFCVHAVSQLNVPLQQRSAAERFLTLATESTHKHTHHLYSQMYPVGIK